MCSGQILLAQTSPTIFRIEADSVKITNCDTSELILENHTQGVPGFLFNKGRGRTEFRKLLTPIGGNVWLIGSDTISFGSSLWAANGAHIYNTNTGNVGIHRQSPVAMLDLPGAVNIDDTSSYQIHNLPVLRIGSTDGQGNYTALSAGPGTGSPGAWPGGTFVGDSAGNVSNGSYNTFVGFRSGTANQAYNGLSGENTFIGALSGQTSAGAGNCAIGHNAANLIQGSYNVALGNYAGYGSTGDDNVYIGDSVGLNIQGDYNTFLGQLTGRGIPHSATGLTLVGGQANASQDGLTNATAIGSNAVVASSYTMVFGDANVNNWRFNTNAPTTSGGALVVGYNSTNGNGAYLTKGGVWTNASDKNKKENFETLDGREILEKIDRLPITSWNYKGTAEKHIGPMAQDFHRLFGVGVDDKTITTIDPSGIALVGIQELYRRWQQAESQVTGQQTQITEAASQVRDQQAQIDELKERLQRRDADIQLRREQIRSLLEKLNR
jgi:hypothetical protein